MTEAEWLSCREPDGMVRLLGSRGNERKLRLFAAECFRRLVHLLPDPQQRLAIEVLDTMAEGTATPEVRRKAGMSVRLAIPFRPETLDDGPRDDPHFAALMLYREFASSSPAVHAVTATAALADGTTEQQQQITLLRDIFGNPFRPVAFSPQWRTDTAIALAKQMYELREFGAMPILADALQDAGCDSDDVLNHCRGPGPHVRGCWVVDVVLGKE